ncbi:MAG: TonB-dependent receptor plug domain-containing protein, partial [Aquabacterium sp.]|nr:TonB-dependent receptor plug domain-containing protein [Aquabacterium sp.]
MLTKHKFSAVGAAVAALSGLAFTSAQAQDTQRIEVTGSRILSPNALSPAPIQVLTSADIAASGAVNLQDLILKSPVFGTPGISRTNSNFITSSVGVATVDLRNLGSDRTLVLVNGRRYVAGISGSATVDLNTIPTDFIERVEVLTGGASSSYGSDAVGGVVNIILKRSIKGVQLDASIGQSE